MASQPPLDLNLLRVLVALADAGNVSRAARTLAMSQPACSSALGRLRLSFGDALFVRTGRGMQPTPRAVQLIEAARGVLGRIDAEVLAPRTFDAASQSGIFTLALSDVGEVVFLPKLLERLSMLAKNVTVRSVSLSHEATERGLESGEVDLAVGYFPDLAGHNLFQQRLFTHHFLCLSRADHPVRGSTLTLEQFQQLGHAVVRAEGRSQELFERFLRERQIERRIVLYTPHFMSIPFILQRTDLIATVPHAVALAFSRNYGNLRMIETPFEMPRFDLKQYWHRKYQSDARNSWLRQLVSSLFDEEQDEWKDEAAAD
jgi:DNA-binding transcriptional LysR family regulator